MATPTLKDDEEEEQTDDEPEETEVEAEAETDEEEEETSESEETEEEDVEVAKAERPEDTDDEEINGSITSGQTFGISNKFLLFAGIGAALLVLYLKYIRSKQVTTYDSEEEIHEEVEETMDDAEPESPDIQKSETDPLAADEQAMGHIFEDQT